MNRSTAVAILASAVVSPALISTSPSAAAGTVVDEFDGRFVAVPGPAITLDMTVMVDDGHGTCGTESELAVPAGTAVRYCYTMTNSGDEPVNYHYLNDDQLGSLLSSYDREVEPAAMLVYTEVAVITEAVTSTGEWHATAQGTGADVSATDSVSVEIDDGAGSTTTTVAEPDQCATTTPPPTTSPSTTSSTTSTTTTTTSTTTTATTPFTTTTMDVIIVLPTTPTTVGEPVGFARPGWAGEHRPLVRLAAAPCPELPPTGGGPVVPLALAVLLVVVGTLALGMTRRQRT